MKLELKENMYIRTNEGIRKILNEFEEGYELDRCLHYLYPEGHDLYKEDLEDDEDEIVKASYNIIDILEVGDVIIDKEGHKYPINYEFETDYNGEYNSYEITIDDHITLFLKDGLSIITHEQMEQMAYKVGE